MRPKNASVQYEEKDACYDGGNSIFWVETFSAGRGGGRLLKNQKSSGMSFLFLQNIYIYISWTKGYAWLHFQLLLKISILPQEVDSSLLNRSGASGKKKVGARLPSARVKRIVSGLLTLRRRSISHPKTLSSRRPFAQSD